MEDIFDEIELKSVKENQTDSNSVKKDQESTIKLKQRQQPSQRQCIDYQQIKKRNDCLGEIQQLKINIKEMLIKNQRIYDRIIIASPDFAGILFSPKFFIKSLKIATYEEAKIYQHKLLAELDKLYEENFMLEKQLNRARFVQQSQDKLKQDALLTKVNHYQFLRNVWQPNKIKDAATNSEDFIEKLNKKVAMVKLGINRMLKEQHTASNEHLLNSQIQDDFVLKSPKYKRLLKLYQQAMMKLQEQAGFIEKRILQKQKNSKIAENTVQIQNLTRKVKELQIQMSKKDEEIRMKEKELEGLTKKEHNLKFVFKKDLETNFEIKVYSNGQNILGEDEGKGEVQYFNTSSNLTSILEQLIKQSSKVLIAPMSPQVHKMSHLTHKRSNTGNKPLSPQFNLDQIQKDRINLLKKTNILTQNLSQNNNSRRNFSKQKIIEKSPEIERQKQNFIKGMLSSTPSKECPVVDFPSFPISLTSSETKTKFVRSSNRQRGY